MANNETEGFKDKIEVSLDGRQIFYLFFGSAVIATLVFVLGVMVGRRVEQRTAVDQSSLVRDPLAALDKLEGADQLAFPTALRGIDVPLGRVDSELALAEESRGPSMAVGGPSAEDKVDKPEKSKADTPKEKPEKEKPDKEKATKESLPKEKSSNEMGERKAKADAKPDKKANSSAEKESVTASEGKKATGRRFTLQVGSFQDKSEADIFFRQLEGSTYAPYMVEAEVAGKGKYYRVRVGGYTSYDDAVAAKTNFEDKQHVIAYVTRLK